MPIWPLAKWAKENSHLLLTPLNIQSHVTFSSIAMIPFEKAEALKTWIISHMPGANLADIPNASYLAAMLSLILISEVDISDVNKKLHPIIAAGSDGITFFVFKTLVSILISFL